MRAAMRARLPAAAAVLCAAAAVAGCSSPWTSGPDASPTPTATVTVTAPPPSPLAGCELLAAWENGPATDLLWQDPARYAIAQAAAGSTLAAPFAAWMQDLSLGDTADAAVAAGQVESACETVGVTPLSSS